MAQAGQKPPADDFESSPMSAAQGNFQGTLREKGVDFSEA